MSEQQPGSGREVPGGRPIGHRRLIIGGVVLAAVLLLAAWAASGFFARNHVKYLLNQRQYVDALAILHRLKQNRPADGDLLALETQTLAAMGNYDAAITSGQAATASEDFPPQASYWLAIAQYQAGQTSASQASAAAFIGHDVSLPHGADAIAQALAGERAPTAPSDINGLPFRLLFPVEQATHLGFVADDLAESGNHRAAAELYQEAYIRGARNPQMIQRALVSAALAANFDSAEMFLSMSGDFAVDYALNDLSQRQGSAGQPRLRLLGRGASAGGGRLDVARAAAWAHARAVSTNQGRLSEETSAALSALLQEFPYDAAIQASHAQALSAAGDTTGAVRIWQDLQRTEPTLETWLRLNGNIEEPAALVKQAQPFIENLRPMIVLTGASISIKKEETEDTNWPVRYLLETPLEAIEAAAVTVTFIARVPAGQSSGSPFFVKVADTDTWSVAYAAPGEWQLCTIQLQLLPGQNQIELSPSPPGTISQSEHHLPEFACAIVTNPAGQAHPW